MRNRMIRLWAVPLVLAVSFCLLFSSLSPLRGNLPRADSAVFLTMGKAVLDGQLLFRDIFDHKGPVIYLMNTLGLLLGWGSPYGVLVLQMISLALALQIVARLLEGQRSSVYVAVMALLQLVTNLGFQGGNSTEEWALLPGLFSVYLLARHRTSWWTPFVQAVLFSLVFLSKPSAAGIVLAMVAFGAIRSWRQSGGRAVLPVVLFGATALALNLLVYSVWATQRAGDEYLFALFFYSLNYIHTALVQKAEAFVFFTRTFTMAYFLLAAAASFFAVGRRWMHLLETMILAGGTTLAVVLSGQQFAHYFLIFVPVLVHVLVIALDDLGASFETRGIGPVVAGACVVTALLAAQPNGRTLYNDGVRYRERIAALALPRDARVKAIIATDQSRLFIYAGLRVQQKWFIPMTHTISGGVDYVELTVREIGQEQPDYLILDKGWFEGNRGRSVFAPYRVIAELPEDSVYILQVGH